MLQPKFEVDLFGDGAYEFAHAISRDGDAIVAAMRQHLDTAMEQWKQEGKDHWVGSVRLCGPLMLQVVEGPLDGQQVQAFQFTAFALPRNDPKIPEVRHMGLHVVDGWIVDVLNSLGKTNIN